MILVNINLNIVENNFVDMHTYIIGHYNLSVRIIDLVSHTTYVVCVNFIHKRRDLQFVDVIMIKKDKLHIQQRFNLDYDLVLIVVCINFIHFWTYTLRSTPNGKFLRNSSLQFYLPSEFLVRNLLRGSCRRNIFSI